ncbi:MAG: ABC transporter substrate-binding protein [Bacteroidota bacterium]
MPTEALEVAAALGNITEYKADKKFEMKRKLFQQQGFFSIRLSNSLIAITLLPIACCLLQITSHAQTMQRQKIAIFTPLYLDSAFDATGNLKDKNNFPRYSAQGLEFYLGAQAALDSLQKRGAPLEVVVMDTKGNVPFSQQLSNAQLNDVQLMIGQTNVAETKLLADEAFRKKIPFISATLPNDAGVNNNPYFVLLNTTLQSHIEGIYRFLQKNHRNDRIIVFKKDGAQEDQLKEHFLTFAKITATAPLNIKFVDAGNNFTSKTLAVHLDSTKRNICIAGSLDEAFGNKLAHELSAINKTYPVRLMGMPTWERLNFSKLPNIEIVYSAPFYSTRTSMLEKNIAEEYADNSGAKAGDLFFRGYETTLRFALLLLDTKKDVASNLTRKGNTVFTQLDVQPVFTDSTAMTLDYFENKHLYFIKVFGGIKNVIY